MTFEERILTAIEEMKKINYNPQYLKNMMRKEGVLKAVKSLVTTASISDGLKRLKRQNALHLSLESIILEPEWENLLTDNERKIAKEKIEYLNSIVIQNGT
jgi:hypothetical protein